MCSLVRRNLRIRRLVQVQSALSIINRKYQVREAGNQGYESIQTIRSNVWILWCIEEKITAIKLLLRVP